MAERAVFLDRDNTIIDNDGYLGDPSKVKLLTGAATALSALSSLGYRLIVVSNQSGVARGMFDEAAVEAVNKEMCKQLRDNAGVHIDASYYCPFHPDAAVAEYKVDHDWRKPKSGMILQAGADFGLDLSQCWMIGDAVRDIAAGAGAGTRTILLRDPERPAPPQESDTVLDVSPNFVVRTLADAARIISREGKNHVPALAPPAPTPAAAVPEKAAVVPASDGATNVLAGSMPAQPSQEPSPAQTAVAATAVPSAASPDEGTLAEKIVQGLARQAAQTQQAGASKLERSLDELIIQIRQQNRNNDMLPEFSMTKLAAMVVQLIAIFTLLAGLYTMFSAPATFQQNIDFARAVTALQRGMIWTMASIMLQGGVIALLLYSRRK